MLATLQFALAFVEDLANSSDNEDEYCAAQLMRTAIAITQLLREVTPELVSFAWQRSGPRPKYGSRRPALRR